MKVLLLKNSKYNLGLASDERGGGIHIPLESIVMNELELVGSKGMSPHWYGEILTMIFAGKIDTGKLITNELSLEGVSERLEAFANYQPVGIGVVTEF